jgi:nitrite reductase/ring-hydroxylating ferredoxin subunit
MNGATARLCALHDLDDPGSAVFPLPHGSGIEQIMVIRQGNDVFGYLNSCPHTGGPLDWVPGIFLDLEKRFIQCATHDALFRISDGECVHGPCLGQSLQPVALDCDDGWICYRGS